MDTLTPALEIFRKQLEKFVVFTDEEWQIFQQYSQHKTLKKKEFLSSQIRFVMNLVL